jgi:DNA polymerase-3 subunit epsilon
MLQDFPDLAFVDIETTGSNFDRDRITEIGIKIISQDYEETWGSLLNPGTFIPQNIQALTGIRPDMVQHQPSFDELAHQILDKLEGKIFIAHNARFDYGFLKASFKRVGVDFKPKVLCTVKLSRLLFPEQLRHNLDTIISTHGLNVSARHRALGDADLLVQFWKVCVSKFGKGRLLAAVYELIGQSSLPPNIHKDLIDEIPEKPGCYIFYGENKVPIYIGKSISLKSRVMSHFQAALTQRKEMKLSLQIRDIDWIETSGELGALLLESKLIKERMPSMNIKLRRSKDLCAWKLQTNHDGVLTPVLVTHNDLLPGLQSDIYGLFYSKREANTYLKSVARKHHLCESLLGLEKQILGKACFGYQVKQCAGACVGKSPIKLHNLQLTTALQLLKVRVWPYSGPIAIKEGNQMHVIDRWCYLGSAINHDELDELMVLGDAEFDLDIYKILQKALINSSKYQVIPLSYSKRSIEIS